VQPGPSEIASARDAGTAYQVKLPLASLNCALERRLGHIARSPDRIGKDDYRFAEQSLLRK
jgi:hypothetical protein